MQMITLMTSQGSETVTAMFWQNGITVITRARQLYIVLYHSRSYR